MALYTRKNITHDQLLELVSSHDTCRYVDDNTSVFGEARDLQDHFWSQNRHYHPDKSIEKCVDLEIFKTVNYGLGVRALRDIPKHANLGYYGGLLVPYTCGWGSCCIDRVFENIVGEQTRRNVCESGTWELPTLIYGKIFKESVQFSGPKKIGLYKIDGHINGNWAQFINRRVLKPNCEFKQTGRIVTKEIIKEGDELFLKYPVNDDIMNAQTYILGKIRPPSIDTLMNSIWVYPNVMCINKKKAQDGKRQVWAITKEDRELNIVNAATKEWTKMTFMDQQRLLVTGIYFNDDFKERLFCPEIKATEAGEHYITLICDNPPTNNQNKDEDIEVKWRLDIECMDTHCEIENPTTTNFVDMCD